jgi:sulfur-oxidizing protein SoxA
VSATARGRFALAVAAALLLGCAGGDAARPSAPAPAAALTGTAAPAASRRSGYDFMTPELKAMQDDDGSNPAMLWVRDGEAAWARAAGSAGVACAQCHGDARASMKGVAARYPAFDAVAGRPVDLGARINVCRVRHQGAPALARESDELLALEAWVAFQSRGLPIAPPADARLDRWRAQGERLYRARMGQLDFACAQCHDEHAGQRLAGSTIPQAHPTGYPIYRLEWQGMGSLERRLRGCMSGVRAEPFAAGSDDMVALELYLAQRAAGLRVETPAVRP